MGVRKKISVGVLDFGCCVFLFCKAHCWSSRTVKQAKHHTSRLITRYKKVNVVL